MPTADTDDAMEKGRISLRSASNAQQRRVTKWRGWQRNGEVTVLGREILQIGPTSVGRLKVVSMRMIHHHHASAWTISSLRSQHALKNKIASPEQRRFARSSLNVPPLFRVGPQLHSQGASSRTPCRPFYDWFGSNKPGSWP
jgi:hypothetical protein